MNAQLEPMRGIVSQLKKEKDSAKKKVASLEKEMQSLIDKLRVSISTSCYPHLSLGLPKRTNRGWVELIARLFP